MASPNYSDSEESFDGFDSDDINDCHDRVIEIGESDIDISSIGSSDDDDDASSQSDIESTVENYNQGHEQLVTCNPLWTTNLGDFQLPYFTSYMGSLLRPDFDKSTETPIDYFRLFYTQYLADLIIMHTNSYHTWCVENKRILMADYSDKLWNNVMYSEMQAYLGLNILFGLSPSARTRDYWSFLAILMSRISCQKSNLKKSHNASAAQIDDQNLQKEL